MSETSSHRSVEQLREALQEIDVTLACTVCDREEFAIEEASIRASGGRNFYGHVRLLREQIICENCGHVMSFALDILKAPN